MISTPAHRVRRVIGTKRPVIKKIIVNPSSGTPAESILELKQLKIQHEQIHSTLQNQESKYRDHHRKITELEDLDDELKEIVLSS